MSLGSATGQPSPMVNDRFIRFPRTPHLIWLGASTPRSDKLMDRSDRERWLRRPAAVEEKVDGANLGLSVAPEGRIRAQSRGRYLEARDGGQWEPLWRWLALRAERLARALPPDHTVFGEWCYALHSCEYDALPDCFLLFDVYDRHRARFWSRRRRDAFAHEVGLATVPLLAEGNHDLDSLKALLGPSRLGPQAAEGIYLRWDDADWLLARAKLVRPGWVMANDEHWRGPLSVNRLA